MTKHNLIIVDKNDFVKGSSCLNLNNIASSMDVIRSTDVVYLSDGDQSTFLKDRTGVFQNATFSKFKAFQELDSLFQKYTIKINKFLFIKTYSVCYEGTEIFKTSNKKKADAIIKILDNAYASSIRKITSL